MSLIISIHYNQNYLHLTLHYKSLVDFELEFCKKLRNSGKKLAENSLRF